MTHQHALLTLATNPRKPYKPGQQRHTRHTGPIRITTVTHLHLGDITHQHACMLGHRGTAAHKRAWLDQHDHPWLTRELRGDQEQLDRYQQRWAHREAILVTYTILERPRYLAAAGRGDINPDGNADYTTSRSRAIDDLEAIDPKTQDHYAEQALAFCIGRQLNRQKQLDAERADKRKVSHPAPWWEAA
jgi:hypothetical protein